jgi:hypothetical protein
MAVKKKRKPMTEEQKAAAAERLRLAREKRLRDNPPVYKNIHPDVLALDEEHPWHHLKIKEWIKTQKSLLSSERQNVRAKIKGAEAKVASIEGYIRNLDNYLRTGTYSDFFWGEYAENRCKQVCLRMAYYPDGEPKRTVGVWYPDIMTEWTKEMDEEYRNSK